MKGRILGLMLGFLFIGANLFAADGDLIVNGNVGIGTTTNTTSKLYVKGLSGTSGAIQIDTNGQSQLEFLIDGVQKWAWVASGTNLALFQWPSSLPFFMTSAGNLGLGTTSPAYKLHLFSDSAAKPSTSTWTIASDARLKTDIQPYTKGLKEILQIKPVTYKYNGKGGIGRQKGLIKNPVTGEDEEIDLVDTELLSKTNVGVIAQDIQDVVPEAVASHKGKINEDDKDETDILDFNSHSLTYILINAVKELSAQVDSLNKQIADLKAKAP